MRAAARRAFEEDDARQPSRLAFRPLSLEDEDTMVSMRARRMVRRHHRRLAGPEPPLNPPPALPALTAEATRLGMALDDRALRRFEAYRALLFEWNEHAGLTAVRDEVEVERRHFAESLALLAALREAALLPVGMPARVADLGTGGGFPGVPIAIVEPAVEVVLIESNGRRCDFLRALTVALDLPNVSVVEARAEDAGRDPALRGTFNLVTARALAAMRVLVEYGVPLLREGGVLAVPKGSRADEEEAEAAEAIRLLGGASLPALDLPLPVDAPPQRVLLVRRVGPLDNRYPRRAGMPTKRPL